jgi:hypothetical protein
MAGCREALPGESEGMRPRRMASLIEMSLGSFSRFCGVEGWFPFVLVGLGGSAPGSFCCFWGVGGGGHSSCLGSFS